MKKSKLAETRLPPGRRQDPNIPPNESTQLKVSLKPDTYDLYCPVGDHKGRGTDGTATVREG